jgi:hypothetical protein
MDTFEDTEDKSNLSETKSIEPDLDEPVVLETKEDTKSKPVPVLRKDKPKTTLSEKQLERNRKAAKERVRKQMEEKIRKQIEEEEAEKSRLSRMDFRLSPTVLAIGSVIVVGGLYITRDKWFSTNTKNNSIMSNAQSAMSVYQYQQNSLETRENDLLTVDLEETNAFSW